MANAGLRLTAFLVALLVAPLTQAESLRVVAWNLEWFPGWKLHTRPDLAEKHMRKAQDALRRIQPDVLVLDEVRDAAAVRELISVLPGFTLHAITSGGPRPQEIAIASRFPSKRAWSAPWLQALGGPPRGFAFAELDLGQGRSVRLFGVHLKSNRGVAVVNRTYREASSLQLVMQAAVMQRRWGGARVATVLAGDFNTNFDSDQFRGEGSLSLFRRVGFWWPFEPLAPAKRHTWHGSDYDPIQFDHFFTVNAGTPTAKILGYDDVSDHHPIQIELDLKAIR
jgi:hypothetical protein